MEVWEERALKGDFRAVPAKLTWRHSGALAHLIDGYEVAGGQDKLIAIMEAKREDFARTGECTGTALELWLALFAEWRADRWSGGYPKKLQELKRLNMLCAALSARLRAMPESESEALLGRLTGYPARIDKAERS